MFHVSRWLHAFILFMPFFSVWTQTNVFGLMGTLSVQLPNIVGQPHFCISLLPSGFTIFRRNYNEVT
uniref:Uncharacterized protein n=1 Tax=Pristhesancus plagipennis TaxID=1955184 RepID=A0A2K8JLV8_PRIPG|nr:secreted hypothetical protein [Pristhesancus plagipennis]